MTATADTRVKIQGTRRSLWLACILYLVSCTCLAVSIDDHPPLRLLVDELASKHDFDRDTVIAWLDEVTLRDDIIEAVYRPRENLPWHEYRKSFVNEERARPGRAFWKQHTDTIRRASEEYGVPPEIIVAIIGVETRYGRQTGAYRVLDALATLTLRYPERSAFFRNELIEFLLLTRELGLKPLSIKGSYAGAMGAPQFIPSSYRRYAVDFNGDGRRDLNHIEDAIGSVGNFLKEHGWQRGEPIVGAVTLEGSMYSWLENDGPEPRISLRHLARYGILPAGRIADNVLAALISLEGENGPIYRLGYNNFYVLTRYNRSRNYSMAVVELAELIRQGAQNGASPP